MIDFIFCHFWVRFYRVKVTKPKMPDLQPTDDQVVTMIVHRTLFFTPDPSHSPLSDFDLHSLIRVQPSDRVLHFLH